MLRSLVSVRPRRRHASSALKAVAAIALISALDAGCDCEAHRDIQSEINILVRRNDKLVPPATDRLVAYSGAALPQIETALHTASVTGKLHLITAIQRIGDGAAAPVLQHFAVYDVSPDVRGACEKVLESWARDGAHGARAEQARAAQARITDKRAHGEAPVYFGDAGIPGAPATVGAAEPVGAGLDKPAR